TIASSAITADSKLDFDQGADSNVTELPRSG
ncbi:MAG: hypothetical protein ACI8XD_002051, partial [Thermoproteota archaeon]